MDYNPTIHIVNYTDRVRSLNHLRSQELRLTAAEANNLLGDITKMLAEIARLSLALHEQNNQTIEIELDGGGFK